METIALEDDDELALAGTSNRSEIRAWLVCLTAALFFFYEFIQMNMFNAISTALMSEFSLQAEDLGHLSATYLYSTVLCLFPAGILLDRYSTKRLILIALSTCILGTLAFSLSHSFLMAECFRFIAGAGGSFCFLGALMLASRWFPPSRLGFVSGVIVTMAMLGGVTAQVPLTLLTTQVGWRHSLQLDALLGFSFLICIAYIVEDSPTAKVIQRQHYSPTPWKDLTIAILSVIHNTQNWLGGIYTSLLNLTILLLGALWGSLYLQQVHHFSPLAASSITSLIFIGTIVGSPCWGWYSDKIKQRQLPMLLGASSTLLLSVILLFPIPFSFLQMSLIFFLLGFLSSAQIITYSLIIESNPSTLTGTAQGLTNSLIMLGGAIFQPVFGWLMDLYWQPAWQQGVALYTATDYQRGLYLLPLAATISLIAAMAVKEPKKNIKNPL